MSIDWKAIEAAGVQAAMAAMNRGGERIADKAKQLAPVRKVFVGQNDNYKTRLKSINEIRADKEIRKTLNLGAENAYINPPSIVTKRAPQKLGVQRQLAEPGKLRLQSAQARLDRRGRFELKSMRSAHAGSLGGRLRDEIHAEAATLNGKLIVLKVVSPTPYAKYQEFGTRHNPAHPYLRPAGHQSRDAIRSDVGRSVATAVKPLFTGRYAVRAKFHVRGMISA